MSATRRSAGLHGIAAGIAPGTMLTDLVAVDERTSRSLRDEIASAEDELWDEEPCY